ncbi:MAG: DUF2232 domain-containing protein [Gammaproteobacteria bacterium]
MRPLAEFIMRGRWQAIGTVAILGMLGWLLPPVSYLSGAATGLVVLRHGAREGLLVVGYAALGAGLVTLVGIGNVLPAMSLAIALWLPVSLSAQVLRNSRSQGLALAVIGGLAVIAVVAVRLTVDDIEGWWRGFLDRMVSDAPGRDAMDPEQPLLDNLAVMMNGLVAGAFAMSVMIALLIARYWQGLLYNPGGFRAEFEGLRLPGALVPAVVLTGIFATMEALVFGQRHGLVTDLLVVAVAMYGFQGLAIAHHYVRDRQRASAWLVALYMAVLVVPQVALVALAALGLLDHRVNFRHLPAGDKA